MREEQLARSAVEQAALESRGRLLAFLACRTRDLAEAEDALADAFHAALRTWPESGVPAKPEAWLLTAARRRLLDQIRHGQVQDAAFPALAAIAREAQSIMTGHAEFPDDRLKLLFVCAHPAIDAAARTPLMLQTVLGMEAARIASAFLVSPAAMSQRLTRAKTKIREAGIAFEIPEAGQLTARLTSVLEAVYAAYGSGWEDVNGTDQQRGGLTSEAIYLGRLTVRLLPGEPEAEGLMALMLHCEARRAARRSRNGAFVPLSEQDVRLWSVELMEEAERYLAVAAAAKRPGPFQLEAAIQSVHAQRAHSGSTDWEALALLYEGLVRMSPTAGALVGRAAAMARARGAAAGWGLLEAIPASTVAAYQSYWALRAHLLQQLGKMAEAVDAWDRASGLCTDPAVSQFLQGRRDECCHDECQ